MKIFQVIHSSYMEHSHDTEATLFTSDDLDKAIAFAKKCFSNIVLNQYETVSWNHYRIVINDQT
jgi:hypothetical protein